MNQGNIDISSLSFLICGIVRDAERGLRHNIPVISQFCKLTGGYEVILFENDSKDHTKELLRGWADSDPHVHVFMEDNKRLPVVDGNIKESPRTNLFYSKRRIGKMVSLRNQYMDYIKEHNLSADYLMVVDMDVDRISLDGILSSFQHDSEWDAVTAFGYSIGPKLRRRYHDTFALEEYGTMGIPRTEENISKLQDKYRNLKGSEWIRVDSAFGGLAIYRFEAVRGLRYQLLANDDLRVPCRCEHTSLSIQMKQRGYDRFYINPQMRIYYQRLTFSIVRGSLSRRLDKLTTWLFEHIIYPLFTWLGIPRD